MRQLDEVLEFRRSFSSCWRCKIFYNKIFYNKIFGVPKVFFLTSKIKLDKKKKFIIKNS